MFRRFIAILILLTVFFGVVTTAQGEVNVTTVSDARLRSGPGRNYSTLATVDGGITLPATARNQDSSWIKVNFNGTVGWVSAQLLTSTGDLNSLPVELPPPTILTIADFETGGPPNNLGGAMGAAYNPPDILVESYFEESGRGYVVKAAYTISGWAAFWIKLQQADLSPYSRLIFDIKADSPAPKKIKVELKRAGNQEVSIAYITGISTRWKTVTLRFSQFVPAPGNPGLSSFTAMDELVFVVEQPETQGVFYLDNIRVR